MANKIGPNTGARGRGRPKGSPNKTTALVKEALLQALAEAHKDGAIGYFKKQSAEQPVAFMSLIGRVIPTQVEANVAGELVVKWKDE